MRPCGTRKRGHNAVPGLRFAPAGATFASFLREDSRAFSIHMLTFGDRARWLFLPPQRRRPVAGDLGHEKATRLSGFCKEQNRKCCKGIIATFVQTFDAGRWGMAA